MNCVDDYIKFVNNFLFNYYRMLLGNKYDRKTISFFIDKYIHVRYYNDSIYESGNSIDKINRELKLVAKELIKQDITKEEQIKNIFCLFGYVLYIDGCTPYNNLNALVNSLYEDENISIYNNNLNKSELVEYIKDFIKQKDEFFKLFENKNFTINKKRVCKKTYHVTLDQHCKISSLYSNYAIEKAYNSKVVVENKTYLLFLIISSLILKEAIDLDFNTKYIVDFPVSLFEKKTKINRYLNAFDNEMIKSKVSFHFNYKDYLDREKEINDFIKNGFNVAITLDEMFIDDFEKLVIFSYVFVYEKYEYYDTIIDDRDNINANIVTL